ncbi:hypothetical protein KC974_03770 [Candidatus Saccharibacteria bacterium]|jgi:2'-5' RNA ligase|nr:hypothetical protein [Candidatus Saccharibacteria bacterium]MDQ5969653.1 hypothetical protein [Patescibacteria group bacterium]
MLKKFIFHRPVSQESGERILEVTQEILADVDFIHRVGSDAMHLTLLSQKMLRCNKVPNSFNPNYTSFAFNRRVFASKDTEAWNSANITPIGAKGIFGALVIDMEKPEWLSRERTSARKVAGIRNDQVSFKNSDYSPHVTVGKFIGTEQDWDGFYECERRLQTAWTEIGAITLGPLRLDYGEQGWEFQPSLKSKVSAEE